MLRRLQRQLRYYHERGLFHPTEHYLTQGVHGPNRLALESYVSPGSPIAALAGLLALCSTPPTVLDPRSPAAGRARRL
jgi:hypothetical protein